MSRPIGWRAPLPRKPKMPDKPSQTKIEHNQRWSKSSRSLRRRLRFFLVSIGIEILSFLIIMPLLAQSPLWKSTLSHWFLGAMGVLTVCWAGAAVCGLSAAGYMTDYLRKTLKNKERTAVGCWVEILEARKIRFLDIYPSQMWLGNDYKAFTKAARDAVIACLPDVTDEDASLFSEEQRRVLYCILTGADAPLILAVLQALPYVGNEQAIPYVKSLASGRSAKLNGNDQIVAGAQQCLLLLEENLAKKRTPQTLLRAADGPKTKTAELLHPTQNVGVTETQQLLRPNVSDRSA